MKHKVIKLTEAQVTEILNEKGTPLSDTNGDGAPERNINSEESVEGIHLGRSGVDPEPITGDEVGKTLSNNSWWNRRYGFNR